MPAINMFVDEQSRLWYSQAVIRRCLFVAVVFFAIGGGIRAEELLVNPVDLLGLTLDEAYQRLGAPAEVQALRGDEAWHDDVVFYFEGHIYLFWFQNRVWQLRVDHRFSPSFLGIRMGQDKEKIEDLLGPPLAVIGDSLLYQLEDKGYPVRLRLIFDQHALADAYLYRADF